MKKKILSIYETLFSHIFPKNLRKITINNLPSSQCTERGKRRRKSGIFSIFMAASFRLQCGNHHPEIHIKLAYAIPAVKFAIKW